MALSSKNDGSWRWEVARWLFPDGIEATPLDNIVVSRDVVVVRFGKPDARNTAEKKRSHECSVCSP